MAFCPIIDVSASDIRRSVDCFYVIYIQELKLAQIETSSAVRATSVTALITKPTVLLQVLKLHAWDDGNGKWETEDRRQQLSLIGPQKSFSPV